MASTTGHGRVNVKEEAAAAATKRARDAHATTRVVMAFPFSSIRMSGDVEACRDLALVIEDLCEALSGQADPDVLRELGTRAGAIAEALAD